MEYKGRKIGFKRSVGAISELVKIAPGGKIERLGEIFSEDNLSASLEGGAQFLAILNKWYEKSLVFTEDGYKPDPVPAEFFMSLEDAEFTELINEAMEQFKTDDIATVEATDPPGKKNEIMT